MLMGAGEREPFGTWLLVQVDRGDWMDGLAVAARADRGFPRRGDVEEVRKRLRALGADPDAIEALDDAELVTRRVLRQCSGSWECLEAPPQPKHCSSSSWR